MKIWLKRAALGLLVVLLLALTTVWAGSEWKLRKQYEPVQNPVQPATDPASIAEGERLAKVLGCYEGCHGRDMQGVSELFKLPDGTVVRSSNLTQLMREYSPSELEASIRQGIRPDGQSVVAMPSASFAVMSDRHLAQILGFMSDYELQDNEPGTTRMMPLARFFLLKGDFKTSAEMMVEGREPYAHESLSDHDTLGRYLALMTCTECHGIDLGGQDGFSPALAIVRGYDFEAFNQLMREGVGLGGRDLGLMSEMGRRRFSLLSDEEMRALYDYLYAAQIPLAY